MQTDLSKYNNDWFQTGANRFKLACWYLVNVLLFQNPLNPFSGLKVFMLRLFGARIGKGVVIKPSVNIKYPWKLHLGEHCWIGEKVWIDNLEQVTIGNHCCLSQGAMLLCGNHNYSKSTFDLMVQPIVLEDGVWIGAKCLVTGGVTCASHAVLAAGSVCAQSLESYTIYKSHQLQSVKKRTIES